LTKGPVASVQDSTDLAVQQELQRQPLILMRLAENSLTVAESLRGNYFKNTAKFVAALRRAVARTDPVMTIDDLRSATWDTVQGEVVTFIDGGVGEVHISSQVPILLRVGSYCVKTGERHLAEREQFGYYPVILGDLEGGSKERKDFIDIVRITAELLGGLSALRRTPDLRVLMFHGPLVYHMGQYAGHTPFTERDIDLFLGQYASEERFARDLKEDFLREARLDIYPQMTPRADEWWERRLFEPLSWIAYLYRRLVATARARDPVPIVAGVVERSASRTFSEKVLLERVFKGLRRTGMIDYFNEMYGRRDLRTPKALLDRLGYTDTLLLSMVLHPGEMAEPWEMREKFGGLREGAVALPGEAATSNVDFSVLKSHEFGFPAVAGTYVKISGTTEPIRVEVFQDLGGDQILEAARRAYLYARLLPGYGFPVGLDIVDKFAKVPAWMTDAYGKLIRLQLGVSLQEGEINDAMMREILVQAIYMTHRDWLFRPKA